MMSDFLFPFMVFQLKARGVFSSERSINKMFPFFFSSRLRFYFILFIFCHGSDYVPFPSVKTCFGEAFPLSCAAEAYRSL